MKAYVLSLVELNDSPATEKYRELAEASIGRHGGRYLIRGGNPLALEGEWPEGRSVVLVEFESQEALLGWYKSGGYSSALQYRSEALRRQLLLLEGVGAQSS